MGERVGGREESELELEHSMVCRASYIVCKPPSQPFLCLLFGLDTIPLSPITSASLLPCHSVLLWYISDYTPLTVLTVIIPLLRREGGREGGRVFF